MTKIVPSIHFLMFAALCAVSEQAVAQNAVSEADLREIIIEKFTRAVNGEGSEIGPVMSYKIVAYNKESHEVSIEIFSGANYQTAKPNIITKKVVFFRIDDEEKLTSFDTRVDGEMPLSMTGFIDNEFDCFVCMRISPCFAL